MPVSATIAERASRTTGGYKSGVQWPPRAGYYTPAKMPLNVIYPRPNSETQTHARHRWAHTGFKMQIPIGVQGGAWPFRYEIIHDTSGAATIGKYYGDSNYGVLEFDNTQLEVDETYEYTVRVTDAGGAHVDIAREFTVDDSKFIFVQADYTGTKVGTIDQPLVTFADWYKSSKDDATYAQKIIVWRSGVYEVVGNPSETNGNIDLTNSKKSSSFVGFPEEFPQFDCATAKFYCDDNQLSDFYSSGVHYKNARRDIGNSHYFWFASSHNRLTYWNNKFTDMIHGTSGTDNNCAIFVSSTASLKNYFYYADNLWQDVVNQTGNNGGYCDFYYSSNILLERNTARNCKTAYGFWLKASTAYVTVRGNSAYENCEGAQITFGFSVSSIDLPHDYEMCWNRVAVPAEQNSPAISMVTSGHWEGQHYNVYMYRNTVIGGFAQLQYGGAIKYFCDANIIASENLDQFNEALVESEISNLKTGAFLNSITDDTGKLLGATGFGTHGHEVY